MNPNLTGQRRKLANALELWQFDLLTAQTLSKFARDHGLPAVNAETIFKLWQIGLLRAEVISTRAELRVPLIELVSSDTNSYTYCDLRQVERRKGGYGGALASVETSPDGIELLFHPFRLYVIYHLGRVFQSSAYSLQYLLNPGGLNTIANFDVEHLDQWTASEAFSERFEHWNRTAETAIVLEPAAYTTVYQSIRWRFPDTEADLRGKLDEHRDQVRNVFLNVTTDRVNEIRAELCRTAETLDPNKLVHMLLRLMTRHERLKLRGAIGGAMHFLCMAEIIRRAAEDSFGRNLPEEDELGYGQWMEGARKSIYGTERLLDSTRETRRDFLTSMGLDYGIKVRCYVEGDTEFGALTSAVGDAGGTDFVNLRGQVLEKRGKGLAFTDSLKNDAGSHVFSVVVLDSDRQDYVRALKKAARDDVFFGRFFVSDPDVELANFTIREMLDTVLELNEEERDHASLRNRLMPHLASAKSAKEFFKILNQHGCQYGSKDEAWGTALMNHALRNVTLPPDHRYAGRTRPLIDIARLLIQARDSGYIRSLEAYRVDPETGELRER